jgi:choline dehydrogenase-like flavoprotein
MFKSHWDHDFDGQMELELAVTVYLCPRVSAFLLWLAAACTLPEGRMLGGSTLMNAMIYMLGSRAEYDGRAAGGAQGCSLQDGLLYIKRPEDDERGAEDYHGVGDPLHMSDARAMSRVVEVSQDRPDTSQIRPVGASGRVRHAPAFLAWLS